MGAFANRRRLVKLAKRRPTPPPAAPGDTYPGSYDQLVSTLGLTAGAAMVVPAGEDWLLDTDTPALGAVTIAGNLWVDTTKSTSLTASYVSVTSTGKYQCGTPSSRLSKSFTHVIECNGTEVGKATAYSTWQSGAVGSTSTGLMKAIWEGSGIDRAETYTVTFTGTGTTFSVSGSSSGSLGTGTVGTAFNNKIHFVATGTFAAGNTRTLTSQAKAFNNTGLQSRGFIVDDGGSLRLFGALKTHRLRLQQTSGNTFAAGATALKTDIVPSNWDANDQVIIGPTEFYQWGTGGSDQAQSDSRTLTASMTDTNMSINSGLSRARWAVMQYVNQTGTDAYGRITGTVSTTNTGYTTHYGDTPTTVDQRAWVINVTRNIKFQGPDDATWQATATGRVGAHMMIMGRTDGKIQLDSVEFYRCGQRGRIGRYPIHFHMNSYEMPYGSGKPSNGVSKGAMTNTYLRNCAVNFSAQHGYQLHGVMGVELTNCVSYACAGHAFNTEDGSERRNTFTDCIAIHTTEMPDSTTLQLRKHEANAAGFWITNPDNDLTGCVAVRAIHGIWLSPAEACFGLSRDIDMIPSRLNHGIMLNQYSMCTREQGVLTGHIVTDELGTANGGSGYYWPTTDESINGVTELFTLTGYQIYKSGSDAYTNRGGYPRYVNFITADNGRTDFSGSITMGKIVNSLIVSYTANLTNIAKSGVVYNGTTLPTRRGMASYHYTLVPDGCLFINWTAKVPGNTIAPGDFRFNPDSKISGIEATSGAIGSDDLYMKAIEMGFINIVNCKFMSSAVSPFSRTWDFRITYTGQTTTNQSTSIAGAKWDANGIIGGTSGRYIVYDTPMYTYGAASTYPIPDDIFSVGVEPTDVLPYGLKLNKNNNDSGKTASYLAERLDASNAVVGTWNVQNRDSVQFGKDKMFVPCVKNGKLRITLQSGRVPTTEFNLLIDNANRSDDTTVIGVSWNGANASPQVYSLVGEHLNVDAYSAGEEAANRAKLYSSAGMTSIADVAASAGNTYWYDQANDMLWLKYKGGLTRTETMAPSEKSFNEWVYQQTNTICIKN